MCASHQARQLSHAISLSPLKGLAGEQVLSAHIEEIKTKTPTGCDVLRSQDYEEQV